MEFELACSTWIKEADEVILKALQASPRWLTAEELQAQTGLPLAQVESTLWKLGKHIKLTDARNCFLLDLVKDEE